MPWPALHRAASALAAAVVWGAVAWPAAQSVSPDALRAAIDKLGAADYAERAAASRVVRRAPTPQAAAALIEAAAGHIDGFVRFRALILLTGFPDPRVRDLMGQFLSDPNDRLRQAAYRYFEHHPDAGAADPLLAALATERAEFVRPSLLRALAARGSDPRVRQALLKETASAKGLSRGALIEAFGDYRAAYAADFLVETAKSGSANAEAALAIGKLRDQKLLPVLAGLQRSAPSETQPTVAAAICLLGVNCGSHVPYLERLLRFAERTPGYQPLVRGAAAGLGAIAAAGSQEALGILLDSGAAAGDPLRAPIALAVGTAALRNPTLLLGVLAARHDQVASAALLAEAFDMLEEDYDKEQFFVAARRAFWQSPEASPMRGLVQLLIEKLDF